MPSSGTLLSGRYLLEERIAAGGMGEVWRGTDTLLKRRIAVKVLLPALVSDSAFITRFRTEARMMAALRHPGIVQVYDCGEDTAAGGALDYLVMEFIDGTALSASIEEAGTLDPRQTLTVIAQAADALQVAHEAGIVHRDIKPGNLLIRPGGAVVVVDFGIARSTAVTSITGTNVVMGSAHYMAPEQAEGKPVSPVTDVYALGAVAFSCLTGHPPYTGEGPLQVLTQLVYGEPATLPPGVPAPVADVVHRAMDRDPARRFPSAAALAAAARAALDGTTGHRSAPPGASASGNPRAYGSAATPGSGNPRAYGSAATPGHGNPRAYGNAATPGSGNPRAYGSAATPGSGNPRAYGSAATPGSGNPRAYGSTATPGHGNPSAYATPSHGNAPAYANPAPPTSGGRRRRTPLVLLAAGVAIAVGGAAALGILGPGQSEAQTQPDPVATTAGGRPPATGHAGGANPTRKTSTRAPRGPAPSLAPTRPVSSPPTTEAADDEGETTNPYTPREVCGSGFREVDSQPLRDDGTVVGRVHLFVDEASGTTCAVTFKTVDLGESTPVTVHLQLEDGPDTTDSDDYEYYAGPVKAQNSGGCVVWGGSVDGASYDSPPEHCG